jgi:hypothetical protein
LLSGGNNYVGGIRSGYRKQNLAVGLTRSQLIKKITAQNSSEFLPSIQVLVVLEHGRRRRR